MSGDGAARAAVDAALAQAAAVPAEHRVDEGAADGARELAVVGEPRPELERQRERCACVNSRVSPGASSGKSFSVVR